MVQHKTKQRIKADDYVTAFKTGILPDGTKLSDRAERTMMAQIAYDKSVVRNKPLAVSNKVKYFILNLINNTKLQRERTVNIGKAALHSDVVSKRLADNEEVPDSRYTAWAGVPCKRLATIGLLDKQKVKNTDTSINRKFLTYYSITQSGKLWLSEFKGVK